MRIILLALLLAGCSNIDKLVPVCTDETTMECSAVRCTEYQTQVAGYFTASSGAVQGRQVTFYGPVPEGVTVDAERCTVTVNESQ